MMGIGFGGMMGTSNFSTIMSSMSIGGMMGISAGGQRQIQMLMTIIMMMMSMLEKMMGGIPRMMPGMGGMPVMPGMGSMPGIGGMPVMPGMGSMPSIGGMPVMGGMGSGMAFALGGFLGSPQFPPIKGGFGMGGMMGMGGVMGAGKAGMGGGLRIEGNRVITPGGYSISYQGTTVEIAGMGGKDKQAQGAGGAMAGFFAAGGAAAVAGGGGASAAAGMMFGGVIVIGGGAQQGGTPTGKTKIWGDPHVEEGDGGKWDWKSNVMTFNLPDGTKVTMNAQSAKGVVKSVDVYSPNGQHVHGENGKWQGGVASDGFQADAAQPDGESVYARGYDVSSWYKPGSPVEIAQQYGKK